MILTTVFVVFVIGSSLMAENRQKVYRAPEHETDKMGVKLVRGITNVGTGWCEFPRQIYRSYKSDGAWLCVPYGLGRGLAMTFVRTMYGALETVFFFIPFDGGYNSALNPAFVWEKEAPPTPEEDFVDDDGKML